MSMRLDRNVPAAGRRQGARVRCPQNGCSGTLYTLASGEELSRSRLPGDTEARQGTCDSCGLERTIRVRRTG